MNFFRHIVFSSLFLTSSLFAAGEPLKVGVESYEPPFVMQGANNELYGYDVAMMNSLCKLINRTCQFRIMKFEELLPAVARQEIDTAVSAITITAERSRQVNFTIPYLLSYSRFLAKNVPQSHEKFSLALLNGKKFGIERGTIFNDQIMQMGIKDPVIKLFPSIQDALEGLNGGGVDFLLLDNPTAIYWAANSSDAFITIGDTYQYGFGFGIAVNPSEKDLLNALNSALQQYQDSEDYKANYSRYLVQF